MKQTANRRAEIIGRSARNTVPQIFIDDFHIGGSDDLEAAKQSSLRDKVLAGKQQTDQDP